MKPVVSRLEEEYRGKVEFKSLNIDDAANDAAKKTFKFRYQPQFVLASADSKILSTSNGMRDYEDLKSDIEKALAAVN